MKIREGGNRKEKRLERRAIEKGSDWEGEAVERSTIGKEARGKN